MTQMSSEAEEQLAVSMETVLDSLESSLEDETDDESKWCRASGLLLKAVQVSTMLKKAPNEEQKQMSEYLQARARENFPPSLISLLLKLIRMWASI